MIRNDMEDNINKTKLSTLNTLFLQSFHEEYSKIQNKEMSIRLELNE